jgi:hypothetical protein
MERVDRSRIRGSRQNSEATKGEFVTMFCVRRCSVSIRGKDNEIRTAEFDFESLFHAAEQGILQWCLYSWFSEDQPIEVVRGEQRWTIDQQTVRKWRAKQAGSSSELSQAALTPMLRRGFRGA